MNGTYCIERGLKGSIALNWNQWNVTVSVVQVLVCILKVLECILKYYESILAAISIHSTFHNVQHKSIHNPDQYMHTFKSIQANKEICILLVLQFNSHDVGKYSQIHPEKNAGKYSQIHNEKEKTYCRYTRDT